MSSNHINSMNFQRLTISLPNYLYQELVKQAQPRKMSRLIVSILEENIFTTKAKGDPIVEFFKLRKILPKKEGVDILAAIKKGYNLEQSRKAEDEKIRY